MAHLAGLHDAGFLLAAGPLDHDHFRGLSLLRVDADEALRLAEADPAVIAGRFDAMAIPWMVPRGAITFSRVRFPRSVAETGG